MLVHIEVSGFYDWEPADKHPGLAITEADLKAGRAKVLSDGKYHVRVEKDAHVQPKHYRDHNIHELAICRFIAEQAAYARNEIGRADAVAHFVDTMTFHHKSKHLERRHVKGIEVHDGAPHPELMRAQCEAVGLTGAEADAVLARYTEDVDVAAELMGKFGPRPKKGAQP